MLLEALLMLHYGKVCRIGMKVHISRYFGTMQIIYKDYFNIFVEGGNSTNYIKNHSILMVPFDEIYVIFMHLSWVFRMLIYITGKIV